MQNLAAGLTPPDLQLFQMLTPGWTPVFCGLPHSCRAPRGIQVPGTWDSPFPAIVGCIVQHVAPAANLSVAGT